MTIAERYYRKFCKVKTEKLTSEQWKVVRMIHACLKENNKPKLPRGTILVNRESLKEHLDLIQKAVDAIDKVYEDRTISDKERGSQIAKIRNALEFSTHSMKHFQLDIPLESL